MAVKLLALILLGTDHYFPGGGWGGGGEGRVGVRNIKKKLFAGPERQNKLFANTTCIKKKLAVKSDKLLKILVPKLNKN